MGQKRIFFGAFNDEEIVTIIKERLGMVGNLHDVRLVIISFIST
jgi:hypothetical protein